MTIASSSSLARCAVRHYRSRAVVVFYCPADRNCDYAVCVFTRPSVRLSVCLFVCLRAHLFLRHHVHSSMLSDALPR